MKENDTTDNITMMKLQALLQQKNQQKIVSLPLQFEYLPVDILSKQFTKLNSPHQYRIHYLGPRFANSHILHKKYSSSAGQPPKGYSSEDLIMGCERYQINLKKIIHSHYITERLKSNHYYKSAIFYRAFQGMNPSLNRINEYQFNSSFEGGNLDCVIKINPNQFDLFLRIDSNTRGHLQWFYFSIKNNSKKGKIVLHLCNISKSGTLYENGMQPFIFSKRKYQLEGKEWEQEDCHVTFGEKLLRYNLVYEKANLYPFKQLTFQYDFIFEDDQVFFAYCVPYTYSRLIRDINLLNRDIVKVGVLGRSLTGVDIPILHITNHSAENSKKNVLITGRIHPGQSNSSYVLNGFINYLCSQSREAKELRNRMNFLIVPMINPDGVIMGNSRSSAAGKDLNRQFKTDNFELFPEVCLLKKLAFKIKKKYGLMFYLDFHGHSRRKNTFFYGPNYNVSQSQYYQCRILPKIIQKITNGFRYYSCSFNLPEEKKKTGRGVFFEKFKIPFTYTVESSIGFFYNWEDKLTYTYDIKSWETMGANICKGFSQFIVSMEEFQELMIEKRIQRRKIRQKNQKQTKEYKQGKQKTIKKFLEDEGINSQFFRIMQQIKSTPIPKNIDPQMSSDQHNDQQDLQSFKFMEFNNLVSGKKDKIDSKNEGLNYWQIQQIKQDKDKQETIYYNKILQQKISKEKQFKNETDKKIFDRIVNSNFKEKVIMNIKKKYPVQRKSQKKNFFREQSLKQLKEQTGYKSKRKDSKQIKCLVLGRDFFPQTTCQVVELPRKSLSSNFRRQINIHLLKKLQQPLITYQTKIKHFPKDSIVSRIQSVQKINIIQPGLLLSDKQKNRWRTKIQTRKTSLFSKSCLFTGQRNDQVIRPPSKFQHHQLFINPDTMDIDNVAMTIKTFNK